MNILFLEIHLLKQLHLRTCQHVASRIPLVKGVRSPVSELPPALRESGIPSPGNGVRPDLPLSPALRSEVLLPGAKEHNSGGGKGARRSRIPDIR